MRTWALQTLPAKGPQHAGRGQALMAAIKHPELPQALAATAASNAAGVCKIKAHSTTANTQVKQAQLAMLKPKQHQHCMQFLLDLVMTASCSHRAVVTATQLLFRTMVNALLPCMLVRDASEWLCMVCSCTSWAVTTWGFWVWGSWLCAALHAAAVPNGCPNASRQHA